jgi:hypothetical protein
MGIDPVERQDRRSNDTNTLPAGSAARCEVVESSQVPDLHRQQEDYAMKARWVLLAGSLLVTGMTSGVSGVASADSRLKCKDSMLDGLYVFTATGYGNVDPGPPQPQAIVELIRFNGDGTVDVPGGRVSVNGAIFTTGGTGTYTTPTPVDRGCETSLTFSLGPILYIFIPPDAKTLQMILTNPNTVFQGSATKVSN